MLKIVCFMYDFIDIHISRNYKNKHNLYHVCVKNFPIIAMLNKQ